MKTTHSSGSKIFKILSVLLVLTITLITIPVNNIALAVTIPDFTTYTFKFEGDDQYNFYDKTDTQTGFEPTITNNYSAGVVSPSKSTFSTVINPMQNKPSAEPILGEELNTNVGSITAVTQNSESALTNGDLGNFVSPDSRIFNNENYLASGSFDLCLGRAARYTPVLIFGQDNTHNYLFRIGVRANDKVYHKEDALTFDKYNMPWGKENGVFAGNSAVLTDEVWLHYEFWFKKNGSLIIAVTNANGDTEYFNSSNAIPKENRVFALTTAYYGSGDRSIYFDNVVLNFSEDGKSGVKEERSGLTFKENERYNINTKLTETPKTFEAWLKTNTYPSYYSSIFDNSSTNTKSPIDTASKSDLIVFATVNSNNNSTTENNPTVYYYDTNTASKYMLCFDEINVYGNNWQHIAITVDESSAICYVNGEIAQTLTETTSDSTGTYSEMYTQLTNGDFADNITAKHILGHNNSGYRTRYFWRGEISALTLYSDVCTADEIKKDMSEIHLDNGILSYNLDGCLKKSLDIISNLFGEDKYDISSVWEFNVGNTLLIDSNSKLNGASFEQFDNTTSPNPPNSVPRTFEAWIRTLDANGAILSNKFRADCISLELKNYYPTLTLIDSGNKNVNTLEFDKAVINSAGRWTHIAITIDDITQTASCYINGELIQQLENNATVEKINNAIAENKYNFRESLVVGGDSSEENYNYFTGEISSISLYNDVRNADEIKADINITIESIDKNDLLLSYDFSKWTRYESLSDNVTGKYDIEKTWYSAEAVAEERGYYDFSIAVIPDPQYITQYDSGNKTTILNNMYNWIINNRETNKTELVVGVGDIVNGGNHTGQWSVAEAGFKLMDDAGMPYTVVPGNHDTEKHYNKTNTVENSFNKYITPEKYGHCADGLYDVNNMRNNYKYLTVGEYNYLILNIDFEPEDEVLDWANNIIKNHPYHTVIIATHSYVDGYGDLHSKKTNGNSGADIWEKLVRKHKNISFVISGHIHSHDIIVREDIGDCGNKITSMLIDYQFADSASFSTFPRGRAMVAMLYFSNKDKSVRVEWVSTVMSDNGNDPYYKAKNQFTLNNLKLINALDVNLDNTVNLNDTLLTRKLLLNLESVYNYPSADPNQDGKFNIADLLRIKKKLAGAI